MLWSVISALRVHAVSGRNLGLATLTFVLGSVPVVTNIVNLVKSFYTVIDSMCLTGSELSLAVQNRGTTSPESGMFD
ncbi:hypothetical protein AcW1_009980 [Taiwanofungus camphoratus]|nr:hypothetical protein AcV5_003185 [Antrodia cinnamomea]KAI0946541.1 hypothetical protein AcW1_009980 [Antrodia cinnamomea]